MKMLNEMPLCYFCGKTGESRFYLSNSNEKIFNNIPEKARAHFECYTNDIVEKALEKFKETL